MDIQVEEAGTFFRKLSVTVPQAEVDQAFDSAFKRAGKAARIPGFRPGKAPRSVLQMHYGAQIKAEVEDSLVQRTLPLAMAQSEVNPVTRPAIEPRKCSKGNDFIYVATVEVQPPIALTKYEGLEVENVPCEVSDDELTAKLDELREQNAQMIPVEGRDVVEDGDTVVMDYEGFIDDEAFEGGTAEGAMVEVGAGNYLPGFESAVRGKSVPSEIEFPVEFPEDYGAEQLAGKTATFKGKLHELKCKEQPALDDDFAQDLGEETLDALKDKLTADLLKGKTDQAKQKERTGVIKALVDANPFEVAPSMVDEQAERMVQNAAAQMQQMMGFTPQLSPDELEKLKDDSRENAEEHVRGGLLLMEVTKALEVDINDEDIDAEIERMAEESGVADQVRAHFGRPDQKQNLRYRLLEDRTLDLLLEKAVRVEPKPEEAAED
jgi:trigger factor